MVFNKVAFVLICFSNTYQNKYRFFRNKNGQQSKADNGSLGLDFHQPSPKLPKARLDQSVRGTRGTTKRGITTFGSVFQREDREFGHLAIAQQSCERNCHSNDIDSGINQERRKTGASSFRRPATTEETETRSLNHSCHSSLDSRTNLPKFF